VFHDPALQGQVSYNGTTWTWAFNFNLVSLGYNSYFLDCAANPAGTDPATIGSYKYASVLRFKRTQVVQPSDCLVFGDKQPKPNDGANPLTAGGSLWWAKARGDLGVHFRNFPQPPSRRGPDIGKFNSLGLCRTADLVLSQDGFDFRARRCVRVFRRHDAAAINLGKTHGARNQGRAAGGHASRLEGDRH
jgi:hypothetical protein